MIHAAKKATLMHNKDARRILVRKDAHDGSINSQTGEMEPDERHLTVDYKTDQMIRDETHQTLHGYIEIDPTTKRAINYYNVGSAKLKDQVESDTYFRKFVRINNWGARAMVEVEEPDELQDLDLGDDFFTIPSEILDKLESEATEDMKKIFGDAKENEFKANEKSTGQSTPLCRSV
ncbi:hypothetical protein MMC13_000857 [Lambiella insularis]|nr:hypothetical protein [Lambiella insularis]